MRIDSADHDAQRRSAACWLLLLISTFDPAAFLPMEAWMPGVSKSFRKCAWRLQRCFA